MFKNPKRILACFLATVGFFMSTTSYADSVMINKEVAEPSPFYEEVDGNLNPVQTIDTTDLYNMISEDESFYKIEYEGKIGYV